MVLATAYTLLSLPVQIAFLEATQLEPSILAGQYVCDAVFFLDIVLRLWFMAFLDQQDVVRVRRRVMWQYLHRGSFVYHVVAAVPTDVFLLLLGPLPRLSAIQSLSVLRVNRLVRCVDLDVLVSQLGVCVCVYICGI